MLSAEFDTNNHETTTGIDDISLDSLEIIEVPQQENLENPEDEDDMEHQDSTESIKSEPGSENLEMAEHFGSNETFEIVKKARCCSFRHVISRIMKLFRRKSTTNDVSADHENEEQQAEAADPNEA